MQRRPSCHVFYEAFSVTSYSIHQQTWPMALGVNDFLDSTQDHLSHNILIDNLQIVTMVSRARVISEITHAGNHVHCMCMFRQPDTQTMRQSRWRRDCHTMSIPTLNPNISTSRKWANMAGRVPVSAKLWHLHERSIICNVDQLPIPPKENIRNPNFATDPRSIVVICRDCKYSPRYGRSYPDLIIGDT